MIGHKFRIHPELSIHGNLHVLRGQLLRWWVGGLGEWWVLYLHRGLRRSCILFLFIVVVVVFFALSSSYYYYHSPYNSTKSRVRQDFTTGLGNGQMERALNPSLLLLLFLLHAKDSGAETEDCIEFIFHLKSSSNCSH